MSFTEWTPDTLSEVGARLERSSPREILEWGFERFAPDIAMATGFGPSGIVLMHLVSQLRPETTVFYLDTGLLFPETEALRATLAERLGLVFTQVEPELSVGEQEAVYGPALWRRDPDRCCSLRKVAPLRRFLATQRAWITGLRRDQSPARAHIRPVAWDAGNGLVKFCPLASWTAEDIWGYIHAHELPYNELHDAGYPSIGCIPCTRPVAPGEDERAGRWAGQAKTECGIHLQP